MFQELCYNHLQWGKEESFGWRQVQLTRFSGQKNPQLVKWEMMNITETECNKEELKILKNHLCWLQKCLLNSHVLNSIYECSLVYVYCVNCSWGDVKKYVFDSRKDTKNTSKRLLYTRDAWWNNWFNLEHLKGEWRNHKEKPCIRLYVWIVKLPMHHHSWCLSNAYVA